MEVLRQVYAQAKLIFDKMSPSQKISILLVLVSMIVCLSMVFFWSSRPNYVVLFSNLSMKDAGEIQEKLADLNIQHEVTGTTIKVPAKEVYSARLTLANEGLPRSSEIGFEIFDKIKVGQTDYMQKLNYRRALEGELMRTINSLAQIESSRVHLVIPEETIFAEEEKKTSASIVLTLHPGTAMDKASVTSITHLVASSVEGLEPKNITIIDSHGDLLSVPQDDEMAAGLSSRQIDVQRNVEKYLETKAATLLDGILGPQRSIVRVTTEMDFSQSEKTEESYKPDEQVARSENRVEESATNESKNNSVEKSTTNYEIGRVVEHMIGATGTIQWISVAVVVDGSYQVSAEGETKGKKVYVERKPEELESLKKLISSALGLNTKRGDQIEVNNIAFDTTYVEERMQEEAAARRQNAISSIVGYWPWLLVLGIFGVVMMVFKRLLTVASDARVTLPKSMFRGSPEASMAGMTVGEASQEIAEEEEDQKTKALLGRGLKLPAVSKLEQEVNELAIANPDTIARIVRSWMRGE